MLAAPRESRSEERTLPRSLAPSFTPLAGGATGRATARAASSACLSHSHAASGARSPARISQRGPHAPSLPPSARGRAGGATGRASARAAYSACLSHSHAASGARSPARISQRGPHAPSLPPSARGRAERRLEPKRALPASLSPRGTASLTHSHAAGGRAGGRCWEPRAHLTAWHLARAPYSLAGETRRRLQSSHRAGYPPASRRAGRHLLSPRQARELPGSLASGIYRVPCTTQGISLSPCESNARFKPP